MTLLPYQMIKFLFKTASILLFPGMIYGQGNEQSIFLESKTKSRLIYLELNDSTAMVYEIGRYLDVAGSGFSILSTDTLKKKYDGNYTGKTRQVITRNNKTFLLAEFKKRTEVELDTSENLKQVYRILNNAYYLDRYISLSEELNKKYPLSHYSFRNGFSGWKQLPEKESNHGVFRKYADNYLKNIMDSISLLQDQYVNISTILKQNLKTIDYPSLKDSLLLLRADYHSQSWYFGSVVNEISKQNPEYYFKLAEDLPLQKDIIFSSVEENKNVIQSLKEVENHSAIKKEFFKDRKFNKSMKFKIISAYVVIAGLITLLIVAQP
jgi:hypothetical protein